MTYAEILAKLKTGQPLTPEECTELEKLSRPVDRFNDISEKKRVAESERDALKAKVTELETSKTLTEQEITDRFNEQFKELSGKVESLMGENQALKSFKEQAEIQAKVNRIASSESVKHVNAKFADAEYLGVLMSRKGVDIDNEEAVKTFLTELKTEKPEQFITTVKGGTGDSAKSNAQSQIAEKVEFKTPEDRTNYIEKHGFEAYEKVAGIVQGV